MIILTSVCVCWAALVLEGAENADEDELVLVRFLMV